MASVKKRISFFDSAEGIEARRLLQRMVLDATYKTSPTYSTNSAVYPDNLIPFVDKHMNYLNAHPNVDVRHYMANLRLITRY